MLGKTVQVTTLTEIETNDSIAIGDRVQVRGYVDGSGAIVADEVDDTAGVTRTSSRRA